MGESFKVEGGGRGVTQKFIVKREQKWGRGRGVSLVLFPHSVHKFQGERWWGDSGKFAPSIKQE